KRPVEQLSERNYFFKMGQYQARLVEHIEQNPNFIRPESRRNEVLGFLTTQELGDLSISRPKSRLSWGIELPFDHNYVTYVWFDALTNYISFIGYDPARSTISDQPSTFRDKWPALHVIGKDIMIPAHGIYWPITLHALGL